MRGLAAGCVALVLFASLVAGCIGDDDPPANDPRRPAGTTSQGGFAGAEAMAYERAGGGELLAAIGIASPTPSRLGVSQEYPGLSSLTSVLLRESGRTPGDGRLPYWGFLYEESPGASSLTAVVVHTTDDGRTASLAAPVDRSELSLLLIDRAMSDLPEISPTEALYAAREDPLWGTSVGRIGTFVLYVLSAGTGGSPEWTMITADHGLREGFKATVSGSSGTVQGAVEPWPERAIAPPEDVVDSPTTRLPGDQEVFEIPIEKEGHPNFHVKPDRGSTLDQVGDMFKPEIVLASPGGESTQLTQGETHVEEEPEQGVWTVTFTWDSPDNYRSIRVTHCILPIPFLFAEQRGACG